MNENHPTRRGDEYVFASVKYTNAAPLAHFLTEVEPSVRVITGRPAELADWLADGRADAAMIPVTDLFADDDLAMIDGIGICADGAVGSVLVKCNRPPAEVRTVARDPASRTSNALAAIVLAHHLGRSVEMLAPEASERADARVVIGDRALTAAAGQGGDLDLAGLWKEMTGLPFVFAVWAYRRGHPQAEALARIALAARDAGVRAAGELGELHARRLGLAADRGREYLTQAVRYHVGPRETEAMALFRELVEKKGSGAFSADTSKSSRHREQKRLLTPFSHVRITPAEALDLLVNCPTAELMARADEIRRERHGRRTYFVHSLNINPTNVCENRCELCAFWREPDAPDAYVLTPVQARARLAAAAGRGLTDLHIVGGLNPAVDLAYYETLLRDCRRLVPEALVQGMTAVEIDYLAQLGNLPVSDVLRRLKAAGLGAISGGGAEIFAPGVRGEICSRKISADRWLAVHAEAHAIGLPTNATMLFGHVESPRDVVDHLERLRDLQDRTGGFQAFIALPFHQAGTKLPVGRGPGGHTVVRTIALARIVLDNFPHIRALANYMDPKLLHVAAFAGADDLGGTSLDERIARAAGAPDDHRSDSVRQMGEVLAELGLEMVLVNSAYEKRGSGEKGEKGTGYFSPDPALPITPNSQEKSSLSPFLLPATPALEEKRYLSPFFPFFPLGERLSAADAAALYDGAPFQRLGALAHRRRLAAAPADRATFVIDRNISLTNVCESGCKFCAFSVEAGSDEAFTLSIDEVAAKVREAIAAGATQVLVQGGLNPELDLAFYERMLGAIKSCGESCVHSFSVHSLSPTEVHYLAAREGLTVRQTLERLRAAGLDSLPGGGGEILVDEVRRRVSPRKIPAEAWLDVMETAHGLGMCTTATMVYGLGETTEQLVEHLVRIRDLQDRTGGFTAFIPWSFQPANTQMPLPPRTGVDYLRVVAVSRLVLDNVPHIQAGWVTEGPDLAQLALSFGADDFGGVLMEERVVRAAGASYTIAVDQVVSMIREAGFTPVQRTTQYEVLRVYDG